ncbi:DNA methylase N-4 [Vibrio cyclitrophicus]|uniref:site-specific DNA-methyltransferase n=1 Tax=Vibrio cyclitrophicus TaxID=47951 RepID=UPI0007EE9991|nr:site-specific DNA-methyltransferase [Vibrio cyclitrophicus]OBT29311.1 DNA methylase N-4 [Vibrio cyclitrophicus]
MKNFEKINARSPLAKSLDIENENINQLKEIFPEVIKEGKVDFDALKSILGGQIDDGDERFNFSWKGKNKARQIAQTPSLATLRPCKDESISWEETENIFIEGDNLEVLKALQKSYHKKVKMIYIDPPYNTGNDFVYKDNFVDSLTNYQKLTDQLDKNGKALNTNSDSSGRYHTNWLNMIYPRLKLARNLLRDDGIIFISIDDVEVRNLRFVCDEIFGEDNFLAQVAWEKRYTRSNNAKRFYSLKDNILVYRKSAILEVVKEARNEKSDSNYSNPDNDPRGAWTTSSYVNPAVKSERKNLVYEIENPFSGKLVEHPTHAWKHSKESCENHAKDGRLWWGKDGNAEYPRLKIFLSEQTGGLVPIDLWSYKEAGTTDDGGKEIKELFGSAVFDTPKPTQLIRKMLGIATSKDNNDIILDFFAGSGTTGHSVLLENEKDGGNRRFILVQLPEPCLSSSIAGKSNYKHIAELTKERLRKCTDKIVSGDIGFKSFKLDTTNIRLWDADFDNLEQVLQQATESIKADRSSEDVLYEIFLKYGYDLTTPVETEVVNGKTVFVVGAGSLFVCLDDEITTDTVEGIAKLKEEYDPETTQVVFKDEGFADDQVKTNAIQILKQAAINDVKSI